MGDMAGMTVGGRRRKGAFPLHRRTHNQPSSHEQFFIPVPTDEQSKAVPVGEEKK